METKIEGIISEFNSHTDWVKPISSAYLVMLRRYHSFIFAQSPIQLSSFDAASTEEFVESMVPLKQLEPIFEEFQVRLGHQAFGVDMGRYIHPSDYGIFGYYLMNCASLGDALGSAAKLKSFRNPNMISSLYKHDGLYSYEINTLQANPSLNILTELDFSAAFQFGRLLVGPHRESRVKLESVHFKHSPLGPIEIYEKRFECPVFFEQEKNRAQLTVDVAELPVYAANPRILSVLEKKIKALMARQNMGEKKVSEKVHALLNNAKHRSFPSAKQLAQSLNMSLSSLKKNLKDEGTSYQILSEEVKKTKSAKLLAQSDLAIKTIAFELGFSNPSAFNRAFKRWTGESPATYRKRCEEGSTALH